MNKARIREALYGAVVLFLALIVGSTFVHEFGWLAFLGAVGITLFLVWLFQD